MLPAFGAVFLIMRVQMSAGPEFAFSLLYLVLIITVTWMVGSAYGAIMSLISASAWLLADLSMIERFSSPWIPFVNESLRLVVFLFIVLMIGRYRKILVDQKELAATDPLTGVANRRAFFHLAGTEINRSRRYGHPFSILVIDIDDFKQINDNMGHQTGDRLLVRVIETIKNQLRAIDIVSRFGGDEFVVLLVRSDEKNASLIVGKLLKKLQKTMADNHWPVTFSIGVATYRSVPENVEEAIRAADELMYEVKHNGKNDIRHAVLK